MMIVIKPAFYFALLLSASACHFVQEKTVVSSKNAASNIAAVTPTPMPAPSVSAENSGEKTVSPAEIFKPKNYFILAQTTGDLNGDGRDDLAAVFSLDNPETEKQKVGAAEGEAGRLFVVAVQNGVGKFDEFFSGSKIILCRNCGGMNDNVVPEMKIADRKIYVDQNVLATSDVDYHLEIELKNEKDLILTKGEIENRDRRTGKTENRKIKTPLPLGDFDISKF